MVVEECRLQRTRLVVASFEWVILLILAKNHPIVVQGVAANGDSGDQPLQAINRICFASCTACVRRFAPSLSNTRLRCLHRVFTDELARGNFLVAETSGDQLQHFKLARRDAQRGNAHLVARKDARSLLLRRSWSMRVLAQSRHQSVGSDVAEPDAQRGKECCDDPAVKLQ